MFTICFLTYLTLPYLTLQKASQTYRGKNKAGKLIEKGIAFPVCVSVNECVCHCSPLASDDTVRTSFFLFSSPSSLLLLLLFLSCLRSLVLFSLFFFILSWLISLSLFFSYTLLANVIVIGFIVTTWTTEISLSRCFLSLNTHPHTHTVLLFLFHNDFHS